MKVKIDGIECSIINQTSSVAYCRTGTRFASPVDGNSFVFTSDGNAVIIGRNEYLYVDRWSDQDTWGG